ncbi:hypothetical protein QBC43DRAFT_311948 [Cladorrhinum sp. PSN259]|nr:hypothetical protein QBC43DRAFT_311948 [Cladorrhinum sp. PSN259]
MTNAQWNWWKLVRSNSLAPIPFVLFFCFPGGLTLPHASSDVPGVWINRGAVYYLPQLRLINCRREYLMSYIRCALL